ncbi:TPA: hypothetical protein DDW35_11730 [Candidatus Sumerlaeota bacterium]|nr:hypothetical protein [Candidatus Sumerlaeota bacterium]
MATPVPLTATAERKTPKATPTPLTLASAADSSRKGKIIPPPRSSDDESADKPDWPIDLPPVQAKGESKMAPSTPRELSDTTADSNLTEMARTYVSQPLPALHAESEETRHQLRERLGEIRQKLQEGQTDDAQRELVKLASANPQSPIAPEALFLAAEQNQDNAKRANAFQNLATRYPQTPYGVQSLLYLGNALAAQKKYETALDAFRAYQIRQGIESTTPAFLLKTVNVLFPLQKYEEAYFELGRIQLDHPDFQRDKILDLSAEALMALGRYPQAQQSLQTLLSEYPKYVQRPKALLALGLCLEETGKTKEAIAQYKTLLQAYPADQDHAPFEAQAAMERLKRLEEPLFRGLPKKTAPSTAEKLPEPILK